MCSSFLLLVFLGSKARLQVQLFQEALQAVPRALPCRAPPHPVLSLAHMCLYMYVSKVAKAILEGNTVLSYSRFLGQDLPSFVRPGTSEIRGSYPHPDRASPRELMALSGYCLFPRAEV